MLTAGIMIMSVAFSMASVVNASDGTNLVLSNISTGKKTSFTIELRSSDAVSGVVYVATYFDGTSKLSTIERYDAVAERTVEVDTPRGEIVKVMWWDSNAKLGPVAQNAVIDVEIEQSAPIIWGNTIGNIDFSDL